MARDSWIRGFAIGLAVCCLLTITLQTRSILIRLQEPPGAEADYAVGQTVDLSPVAYSKTEFTLVVFGRHNCSACVASLAGLAKIKVDLEGSGIRLVFASARRDDPNEVAFAQRAGIVGDDVVEVLSTARISRVPSIVLANQHGRVLWTRLGVVTEADVTGIENMILSLLKSTA